MIRLFTAIDLPEEIKPLVAGLGGTVPGSRPVPEEQLHLTLHFIGEVNTALLVDIRECLHSVRAGTFTLKLQGMGYFPPRGAPKVLWAGVTPKDPVTALHQKVVRALRELDLPREKRKFAPHLTLCRLKNSSSDKVARFLETHALLESPEFEVQEFRLYSSVLRLKGAVHRVEDVIPLGGG